MPALVDMVPPDVGLGSRRLGGLLNDRRAQDFARSWKNSHSASQPFRRFGTRVRRSGRFVAQSSWVGEAPRAVPWHGCLLFT